jgi:hypothetical protein
MKQDLPLKPGLSRDLAFFIFTRCIEINNIDEPSLCLSSMSVDL